MTIPPKIEERLCPNCGEPIMPGLVWCGHCGQSAAKKVPVSRFKGSSIGYGEYPVPTSWILSLFFLVPIASCGGCIVFGSIGPKPPGEYQFFPQFIMNGAMIIEIVSIFVGIILLGYNVSKGKQ